MDQNQPVGQADNDLQKAIDNINNPTGTDASFSEPVAAPSSVPEGDSGELGDPVGPFPMPDTNSKVDVVTPGPEPIAPLDPISLSDLSVSGENPADATVITKSDPTVQDAGAPISPANPDPTPSLDQNQPLGQTQSPEPENPAQLTDNLPNFGAPQDNNSTLNNNPNAHQIKEAALRDLVPLLDHVSVDPAQKFKICRDIFEDLHDYSVLDQAYNAASEIQDEEQRADSLLYLIESIDSMN